ncbi:MAG TPA: DUF3592 domain-containing protein [Gemmatimonadales bacterium]|nr:DUF3592 domain-containing protein [Gemmatimonadales bacterium]
MRLALFDDEESSDVKVVQETQAELELRDGPFNTAMMGLLFIVVGGGAITLWLTHPSGWRGNGGPWLIYLVGGVFGAVGLLLLALSADRRYVIDRARGTARLVVQRLGYRTSSEYRLADLQDVVLERSASSSRGESPFYRIVFLTKSGERVPWTPFSTGDQGTLATCAAAVRTFCGWGERTEVREPVPGPVGLPPIGIKWSWIVAFLGIFVAVGLGLFGLEVYRVATWREVSARVLSVGIREVRGDDGSTYAPVVQYQYATGGEWYVSDRVLPINMSSSHQWAERMRDRFRPGDQVTAYVNPDKPSSAYLVREVSPMPLLFVALPLAVVGLLALIVRVRRRQRRDVDRCPVPVVDAPARAWSKSPQLQ